MLILIAANGLDKGRIFEFPENDSRVIGRGSGPHGLLDNTASRMHAEITHRDERWSVQDLQSTNGTFVNGKRITGDVPIGEGDRIQLGCTQLVASLGANDATIAGDVAIVRAQNAAAIDGSNQLAVKSGDHAQPPIIYAPTDGGLPQWIHVPPPKPATSIGRWLVGLSAAAVVYFAVDVYLQHQQEQQHYSRTSLDVNRSILAKVEQPVLLEPNVEAKLDKLDDIYTAIQSIPAQDDDGRLSELQEAVQSQHDKQNAQDKTLQQILTAIKNQPRIDEQNLIEKIKTQVMAQRPEVIQSQPAPPLAENLSQLQNQLQQLLEEVSSLRSLAASNRDGSPVAQVAPTHLVSTPSSSVAEDPTTAIAIDTKGADLAVTGDPEAIFPTNTPLTATNKDHAGQIQPIVSNAFRRIVFVVDASGSLIDSMPRVVEEVNQSIDQLDPDQQFSVIFYQGNQVFEAPPTGLKGGSDRAKAQIQAWILPSAGHVLPQGFSNPIEAMRIAMTYNPDLVCLYSDTVTGIRPGEIGRDELLRQVNQLTQDRGVTISTIQFFYNDPEQTLETLAAHHGGIYRFVAEDRPVDMPGVPDLHAIPAEVEMEPPLLVPDEGSKIDSSDRTSLLDDKP